MFFKHFFPKSVDDRRSSMDLVGSSVDNALRALSKDEPPNSFELRSSELGGFPPQAKLATGNAPLSISVANDSGLRPTSFVSFLPPSATGNIPLRASTEPTEGRVLKGTVGSL